MVRGGFEERAPMEDGSHGKIIAKFSSLVHQLDYANLLLHLQPGPKPKPKAKAGIKKRPAMHKKPAGKAPVVSDKEVDLGDLFSDSSDDEKDSEMETDVEELPSAVDSIVVKHVAEAKGASGPVEKAKAGAAPLAPKVVGQDLPPHSLSYLSK